MLTKSQSSTEIIKNIADYFIDKEIEKAFIFGSFARGNQSANSDIDILVDLSKSIGFMKLIEYKVDLEDKLNRKVDILTRDSISAKILPLIEKDFKMIYERKR